jgi:hypothetical protein
MKKIILFLFLPLLLFGQARYDVTIYRGDSKDLILTPFSITDTARTYRLAVKEDYTITSQRKVYKTSSSGITANYNASTKKITLTIDLERADTWQLTAKTYVYDVEAVSKSDTSNVLTVLKGNFVVTGDVLTPFDNTTYLDDTTRYLPVKVSEFDDGEFIKRVGNAFVGDSLNEVQQLDSLLSLKMAYGDTTLLIPTKPFLILNYYTKTQLNNGQLDSRYYTESEMITFLNLKLDTLDVNGLISDSIATKSNIGHTHVVANITDLQDSLNTKSRTTHNHSLSSLSEKSYNSLTDKPNIPDSLSELISDPTHRLVADVEKATWNAKTDTADVNGLVATSLSGYFLTSNFNNYFDVRFGTKTLDSIAAGAVNVHLTTSLKSTYDGYASQISAKLDTPKATFTMRQNWTQAYNWGNHALAGYADSVWVFNQLALKRDLINHDSLSTLDEKKFSSLTDKPTTLVGYGITNVYTKTETDSLDNVDSTWVAGQLSGKEPAISTLPIAKGGTNNTNYVQNKFLFYNGTKILASGKDSTSFILSTYLDTDTTFAANSDVKLSTQKATRAFADSVNRGHATFPSNGDIPDPKDRWFYWSDSSGAGDCFLFAGIYGEIHTLKKIDSSTVALTIYPDGTETIDGAASYVLNHPYQTVTIQFANGNWHIVANKELNLTIGDYPLDFTGLNDGDSPHYDSVSASIKWHTGTGTTGVEWADIDTATALGTSNVKIPTQNAVKEYVDNAVAAGISDGDKDDINVSGLGTLWNIRPDSVSFAKMQNVGTGVLLGRYSGGSGDIQQIKLKGGLTFSNDSLYINVITALGYTPYNATNPNSYIALTALSSTATGLTYTNTTGAFSLTSGYVIPTTTKETQWDSAYTDKHVHANKTKLDSITANAAYLNSITGTLGSNAYTSTTFLSASDSTDAVSYITRNQFTVGQATKVNYSDSLSIFSTPTQVKGLISDSLNTFETLVKSLISDSLATIDLTPYALKDSTYTKHDSDSLYLPKSALNDSTKFLTSDNTYDYIHDADTRTTHVMEMKLILDATSAATTDSVIVCIPTKFNGMNLINADAYVTTVSSSGTPTFTITNVTDATTMLSTSITIDANEYTSYTAATAPAINASYDDVATGDRIKIKCTVAGTGTKGSGVILVFQKP